MTMTIMETQEIEAIKYQQKVVDMVMHVAVRECSNCKLYLSLRCHDRRTGQGNPGQHDWCAGWKRREP